MNHAILALDVRFYDLGVVDHDFAINNFDCDVLALDGRGRRKINDDSEGFTK
jgi:hypothetical protein